MNKTAKGLVAAAAGGILLLGSAGSVAYWQSTQDVPGGTINSGHLRLVTDATNAGCGAWTLDTAEDAPTTYTEGDPLVPGDVLSKSCAFTVEATGNHLRATVSATAPQVTGTLADALTVGAADLQVGGTPVTEITEAADGQALTVDVTVTFEAASDNTTQDLTATLASIVVSADQVHN